MDQLIPDDYRQALDEKMDLVTYAQRVQYVETRLGLIKHRQLAQAVQGAPDLPYVAALEETPGATGPEGEEEATLLAVLRRALQGGRRGTKQEPASAGTSGPKGGFTGTCFNCNKPGRRAS